MKSILVLFSLVAVAYAGVGVVTPDIQREALALYQRYCSGASDSGRDGSLYVYCKRSKQDFEESLQHNVEITPGPEAPKQVVFVQPPSYKYNHDITVTGGGGKAQQTVIYVLPSKNTHDVNFNDQTEGGAEPEKPRLYFLNNDSETGIDSQSLTPPSSNNNEGYSYNAPQQGRLRYN